MDGQSHHHPNTTTTASASASSSSAAPPSAEPARSRWTPKPEQILILESIFNSGTVNPSKDDTVRIRRLLEKFGPVGDANVFYWFQNRRSRSRRRQRQLQAAASLQPSSTAATATPTNSGPRGVIPFEYFNNDNNNNSINNNNNNNIISGGCQLAPSSSSEGLYGFASNEVGAGAGGVFSISAMTDSDHNPSLAFHSPSSSGGGGIITVFVNGVATQVPAGSFDVKAMFGQDLILVHSTGVPVPVNDYGFCFHGLHHGQTYFLVPRVA